MACALAAAPVWESSSGSQDRIRLSAAAPQGGWIRGHGRIFRFAGYSAEVLEQWTPVLGPEPHCGSSRQLLLLVTPFSIIITNHNCISSSDCCRYFARDPEAPHLIRTAQNLSASLELSQFNKAISDKSLEFTNDDSTARRPGSASSFPGAFVSLTVPKSKIAFEITETGAKNNNLSLGLAKIGLEKSGSDGFGQSRNTWGVFDDRGSSDPTSIRACGQKITSFRKLKLGDILYFNLDIEASLLKFELNSSEFVYDFDISFDGGYENYIFGCTLANDHSVTIVHDAVTATASTASGGDQAVSAGKLLAASGAEPAGEFSYEVAVMQELSSFLAAHCDEAMREEVKDLSGPLALQVLQSKELRSDQARLALEQFAVALEAGNDNHFFSLKKYSFPSLITAFKV